LVLLLRAGGGAPRVSTGLGWHGRRDEVVTADRQSGRHRIDNLAAGFSAQVPAAQQRTSTLCICANGVARFL
jgi:hypothetical protein